MELRRARVSSFVLMVLLIGIAVGCPTRDRAEDRDASIVTEELFDDGLDALSRGDVRGDANGPDIQRDGEQGAEVDAEQPREIEQPLQGLQVLLLTTQEAEAGLSSWQKAVEPFGISIYADSSRAHRAPTAEDFRALAERYDVAIVAGVGAADAYSAPEWNDLPIGLVTTEAIMANRERWHWLDVGDDEPIRQHVAEVKVADPHEVLYGLPVGDRGKIKVQPASRSRELQGYLKESHGTTDRGIVALSFVDESTRKTAQQLVLWEPGPYFTGSPRQAPARRALFGLETTVENGVLKLTGDGERILSKILFWAARRGEPVRLDYDFDPVGLLLTWQRDPTTTMTIDWHTLPEDAHRQHLRYWADGTADKKRARSVTHSFPFSTRTIHRVELTGLKPDTVYLFDYGDDSRLFRFRTMPAKAEKPLHFIVGGDVRHTMEMMMQTNNEAHRHNAAFIAWGGDLAYANGRSNALYRWYEWFEAMKTTLINREGRVIPVIVAIGNHEVRHGYYERHDGFEATEAFRREIAPYFYDLFAFPGQPGYGALDFGDYMSWVILDTAHTNPIIGPQLQWLEQTLKQRSGIRHVFPMYHIPAYPSVRGFIETYPRQVREHIVPLLEAHSIRTAFEAHDHTYKRTRSIRKGAVADDGIVYLGDGAWGVTTREPRTPDQEWYLARSKAVRHFIVGTIDGDAQRFRVFDEFGRLFDAIER